MARKRDEAAFAAKRAQILRAAEALFVEKGFHQTGMAAICEAAGMSPGALYRYFPSKADIIKAFVEEDRAETAELFNALEGAVDFQAALIAALEDTIEAVRDQYYSRLAIEIEAEGGRDPAIAAIIQDADAEAHARLTGLIEQAQHRGEADAALNAAAAAAALIMLINGAVGAGPGAAPAKAHLRAVLDRIVVGLFAQR